MAKINTAERVSAEASDNFVFQRSLLAYHAASARIAGDVLEIGTGAGYGIEVAAPRARRFVTVDKHAPAPELLDRLRAKGINTGFVTLHVGLGTFRPVKVDDVSKHHMHTEFYQVTKEEADKINKAKQAGGRIVCVGTTSCRTIESAADENGVLKPGQGDTDIFIYPGYSFKMMDVLITNFHLPESTLLMLVSALAGKEQVMRVYEEAVQERYRFFSFGDAMIILDD